MIDMEVAGVDSQAPERVESWLFRDLFSFAFRSLVSSCSAVCPLCWLPRRLVYVRHVRTLDSKQKNVEHQQTGKPPAEP
jgi:hypothetical protein